MASKTSFTSNTQAMPKLLPVLSKDDIENFDVFGQKDINGLLFALLGARETVLRRFRPVFHRQNITEQQSRVLRALANAQQIEITGLAEVTCLLPPSISRILHDLELRGLIQREILATDLRRNLISLTPEGRKLVQSSLSEMTLIYDTIIETFGKERFAQLHGLLTDLKDGLE